MVLNTKKKIPTSVYHPAQKPIYRGDASANKILLVLHFPTLNTQKTVNTFRDILFVPGQFVDGEASGEMLKFVFAIA